MGNDIQTKFRLQRQGSTRVQALQRAQAFNKMAAIKKTPENNGCW